MSTLATTQPRFTTGIYHGKLGMWVFLASEIMFFSGFFGAFIVLRNLNIEVFTASAHMLDKTVATINTAVLITSSLTMALAHLALERGEQSKFRLFLFITILCAFGFLGIKSYEYATKFGHHIYPWTNTFFATYFTMTGFHALHVIGGIIPMIWMLGKSLVKGYPQEMHHRVEVLGLYWHFVDLVWIFLFPTLYLIF
ncbi:MAG: cytochrome c oxidase subunit 3 [Bacteroidetes bacterium]|nr:cytochrome c oxidase subunit 3 [Bacteroidota bacterium]